MQNLLLTHIKYNQLNPMTWCATAQIKEVPSKTPYHKRHLQHKGVRLLLKQLLHELKINDTLDESNFPYRLEDNRYYVCFSHSSVSRNADSVVDTDEHSRHVYSQQINNKVAVVLSTHRSAGIDIETNNISWEVVQRFYADNEIAILRRLSTVERDTVSKLLWQIKECFIKIHHYKLNQGLGIDYSHLIADLKICINQQLDINIIDDRNSDFYIAILSTRQTVIVY